MGPRAVTLVLVAVALAGCTGGAHGDTATGPAAGRAAIVGVLVDDRFRPLDLTGGGPEPDRIEGFVLVQETGARLATNPNGEFEVADVLPGRYTLRVQADGHEAPPATIEARAGEIAEVTMVARRIVSDAGAILSRDFVVFIPCSFFLLVNGFVEDCTLDQSGETLRADYSTDVSSLADVTAVVTEMKASRQGNYNVQMRDQEPALTWHYYAVAEPPDTDYIRLWVEKDVVNTAADDFGLNEAWGNERAFQTIMVPLGSYHHEVRDLGLPLVCCGAGATLGTKAQFLQSVFVGPPETDISTYCALC